VFLRLIGITTAAIWFGAAIFLTLAVGPAFFSPDMLKILPRSHAGAAAQLVLERYFVLQYWCGGFALAHLVLEWLYAGKPFRRWVLYLVLGLLGLALAGGIGFQPKLQRLHLEIYGVRSTPQQRDQARKSFTVWHAVAQTVNIFVTLGLYVNLLQVTAFTAPGRFLSIGKFRG
jgi:hypothetical protein